MIYYVCLVGLCVDAATVLKLTFGIDVYQYFETFVNTTSGFKCVFMEESLFFQHGDVETCKQQQSGAERSIQNSFNVSFVVLEDAAHHCGLPEVISHILMFYRRND